MDYARAAVALLIFWVGAQPPAEGQELGPLWSRPLLGEVEGQVHSTAGRLLVTTREAPGRRALVVLDPRDGRPLVPKRVVRSNVELTPSAWRDRVLVRVGERRVELWSLADRRLSTAWSHTTAEPVDGVQYDRGTVFVVSGGELSAFDPGRRTPRWTLGGGYRGTPAIAGDQILAIRFDPGNGARLVRLDRDEPRELSSTPIAGLTAKHNAGPLPRVSATRNDVFVELDTPVSTSSGTPSRFAWIDLRNGGARFEYPPLRSRPSTNQVGWIAWSSEAADAPAQLVQYRGDEGLRILAQSGALPALGDPATPPQSSDALAVAGRLVFDPDSGRVRGELPDAPRSQVLSVGGLVLAAQPSQLVAYPAVLAANTPARSLELGSEPATHEDATAVLENLEIVRATLHWRPRTRRLEIDGQGQIPIESVLWVEDSRKQALFARSERGALQAIHALSEERIRSSLIPLLTEAGASRDIELLRALLDESAARGVEARTLETSVRKLELLELQSAVRVDRVRAEKTRKGWQASMPTDARMLWDRYVAFDEATDFGLRTAILNQLLQERAPQAIRTATREAVLSLLPPEFPAPTEFDARAWLSFAQDTHALSVRILGRGAAAEGRHSQSADALARAQRQWRPDLYAFESDNFLVITSLDHPDSVAHCLQHGEALARSLAHLLGPGPEDAQPLVLYLYPRRADYQRVAGMGEAGSGLSWTAGHFNPTTGLSHMYLPQGEGARERTLETYVHEMTHHWIAQRMPRGSAGSIDPDAPGFWIVEGFASMMEELLLVDPGAAWTIRPKSRRMAILRKVDGVPIPWPRFFATSQNNFHELGLAEHERIATPGYLGRVEILSERALFYHQAASVSHYLVFADEGRHRGALVDALRGYYSGERREITHALGFAAAELGAQVSRWIGGRDTP